MIIGVVGFIGSGKDLISQAQAELEKLEEDLKTFADGGTLLGFIFG